MRQVTLGPAIRSEAKGPLQFAGARRGAQILRYAQNDKG